MAGQNVLINNGGAFGSFAGAQSYILSPNFVPSNSQVTISDTQGANTIDLLNGLEIAGSIVASDTLRLILQNGTTVDILGASDFDYIVGSANPWTTSPFQFNYETVVEIFLGVSEGVPAPGIVHTGGPVTMSLTPPSAQSSSAMLVAELATDSVELSLDELMDDGSADPVEAPVHDDTVNEAQLVGVNDVAADIVLA